MVARRIGNFMELTINPCGQSYRSFCSNMNMCRLDAFYFLVGSEWLGADLNLRVYAEGCPVKHPRVNYQSLNMGKFKDVPVGGGYTVYLIKRVGGNKYFRHNRFLQIHMSLLLQK